MVLQMSHFIEITDSKGRYVPTPPIVSVEIEKSIKNLADTAQVQCVMFEFNDHLRTKDSFDDDGKSGTKIYKLFKRGHKIKIHLGYDGNLLLEFVGYIKDVKTDDNLMILECEDELFQFRKAIKNKTFGAVSVKTILNYIVSQLKLNVKIVCDYDMNYEKFTIYKADAIDVLEQLRSDTGADIYFKSYESSQIGKSTNFANLYSGTVQDLINIGSGLPAIYQDQIKSNSKSIKTELHFRMPYLKKETNKAEAVYSLQKNVEDSQLNYENTTDKKVKIRIVTHNKSGERTEVEYGQPGGEEFEYKVNRVSNAEMKKRAKMEFDREMAPGYKGTFTTWLIPFVEPNYSIGIFDEDFPEKDGIYNVDVVKTNYSEEGGKRTISPGIHLSANKK